MIQTYNDDVAKRTKTSVKSVNDKKNTDTVRAPIEYGIDISILKANLKRTPAERIKRHQIALNTVEKLKEAKFI